MTAKSVVDVTWTIQTELQEFQSGQDAQPFRHQIPVRIELACHATPTGVRYQIADVIT